MGRNRSWATYPGNRSGPRRWACGGSLIRPVRRVRGGFDVDAGDFSVDGDMGDLLLVEVYGDFLAPHVVDGWSMQRGVLRCNVVIGLSAILGYEFANCRSFARINWR